MGAHEAVMAKIDKLDAAAVRTEGWVMIFYFGPYEPRRFRLAMQIQVGFSLLVAAICIGMALTS